MEMGELGWTSATTRAILRFSDVGDDSMLTQQDQPSKVVTTARPVAFIWPGCSFIIHARTSPSACFRIALIVAIFSVSHLAYSAQPELPDQDRIVSDAEIVAICMKHQGLISKAIRVKRVPGFSIAVVNKEGALWSQGFGFTDPHKTRPVNSQTIFSIQSISKTFTATAVLHAVQLGLLDLNEPVTTYLPDFGVNSRFEENPCAKMTLTLLLNHRAGFTHEAPIGNNYDASFSSFEQHVLSIQDSWLKFPVGERYSYSNLGIDLAGYVLQVVAGMPFHAYVKQNIFEPLGMAHSSFDTNWIKGQQNRASGNSVIIPKMPVEIPIIPSGGMYSCAEDMARYIRFHLNGGMANSKLVMSSETLELMYTIPFAYPGQNFGYALGISAAARNNSLFRNHGGGGFGFLSLMMWYPKYELGVMTLSNSTNHNLQNEIAHALADEIIAYKKKILGMTQEARPTGFPGESSHRSLPTEPGPNKPAWRQWLGNYRITVFGYPVDKKRIDIKNGYLHYAGQQLEEFQPGLFFTADGEALDMRGELPTFRNIKLARMELPLLVKCLLAYIALSYALFLIALPTWRSRKTPDGQIAQPPPLWQSRLMYPLVGAGAGLLGLAYAWLLVFHVPFILGFAHAWYSFYPMGIKFVWLMPYVWLLLCAVLILCALRLKRHALGSGLPRVLFAMLTMAALTFLCLLIYWKQI
jgi:CubicO group peptidase (beta-lactamase class C family)